MSDLSSQVVLGIADRGLNMNFYLSLELSNKPVTFEEFDAAMDRMTQAMKTHLFTTGRISGGT